MLGSSGNRWNGLGVVEQNKVGLGAMKWSELGGVDKIYKKIEQVYTNLIVDNNKIYCIIIL